MVGVDVDDDREDVDEAEDDSEDIFFFVLLLRIESLCWFLRAKIPKFQSWQFAKAGQINCVSE